ncbi:MAG TPA: hypothetical protein V6D23_25815, partial [Candidatus Obscuribacterales bacterium]
SNGNTLGLEFRVNNYTTGTQSRPAIALDSDGDFVISWSGSGPSSNLYEIFARRYSAGGVAQGVEFRVNDYTTNHQDQTTVAMDDAGDFVIAWFSQYQDDPGVGGVYAKRFAANGTAQGSEFFVNGFTNSVQSRPAAAMDADGDFAISWESYGQDSSQKGIYLKQYSADGQAQ